MDLLERLLFPISTLFIVAIFTVNFFGQVSSKTPDFSTSPEKTISHEFDPLFSKYNTINNAPLGPKAVLYSYLNAIYHGSSFKPYDFLSSETKSVFSYNDFVNSFDYISDYDLSSIEMCTEFKHNGKLYIQLEIKHYEDPAKWGFNLVKDGENWQVIFFDSNPTHPKLNDFLEWRCV